MLKTVHTFFCILMIGTFLTGYAGLSVHHCLHEGSVNLQIFSGASSCDNFHGSDNTCVAGCCETHDENCCSTRFFSIDDPVISAPDFLGGGCPDIIVQDLFFAESITCDPLKASDRLSLYSLFKPPLEVSVYPGARLVPLRL
ncbi:MAG TPA: hypothetical protein P5167_03710 [Bacteroidales bacterium]|nr:hypothetical protein [Bacteroidales bacterium]